MGFTLVRVVTAAASKHGWVMMDGAVVFLMVSGYFLLEKRPSWRRRRSGRQEYQLDSFLYIIELKWTSRNTTVQSGRVSYGKWHDNSAHFNLRFTQLTKFNWKPLQRFLFYKTFPETNIVHIIEYSHQNLC